MPLDLNKLLEWHGYAPNALQEVGLEEEDLQTIYDEHSANVTKLKEAGESIATYFTDDEVKRFVHSVRCRPKDPESLIEKIIRKKHEKPELEITPQNYPEIITDLIGLRVLHLFKDQWIVIHRFITNKWKVIGEDLYETPKVYYRFGDPIEDFEKEKEKGLLELHPDPDVNNSSLKKKKKDGYRSIHYIVKKPCMAEIQVRTVFEEAWTEIEHHVFYSRKKSQHSGDHLIYDPYMLVFNQLARTADEMEILLLKIRMQLRREIFGRQVISELKKEIENLQAIDPNKRKLLMDHAEALEKYSKFTGNEETLPLGYLYKLPGATPPTNLRWTTPDLRELDPLLDWHPEKYR